MWNIDALVEAKVAERYQRVLAAKEKGFRVPYHKLKAKKVPKVAKTVLQSCVINGGIFLSSLILFYNVILPMIGWFLTLILPHSISGFKEVVVNVLHVAFGSLWIIPVYIVTRVINCLWWQDIADALFLLRPKSSSPHTTTHNNGSSFQASSSPGVSGLLADIFLSVSIESFFLLQAIVFSLLPLGYLSFICSTFHLSVLYSLYAFEYKWWGQRHDVYTRLAKIEDNLPYFLGFGLPLCLVSTAHESALINGCIFSMLFPFLILSAFEATVPSLVSSNGTNANEFRLPVFKPVIVTTNLIFSLSRRGFKVGLMNLQ